MGLLEHIAAIQTERSKVSSCKKYFVYVKGIIASEQPN